MVTAKNRISAVDDNHNHNQYAVQLQLYKSENSGGGGSNSSKQIKTQVEDMYGVPIAQIMRN
jgi:hypothetical protein